MAGVIERYVAALKRDLDFDPALARRMADEVEAHLWDAAEADPAWPSAEAEQRAVERFGLRARDRRAIRDRCGEPAGQAHLDRAAGDGRGDLRRHAAARDVAGRCRRQPLGAGAADRSLCLHRGDGGGSDRLVGLPPLRPAARVLPRALPHRLPPASCVPVCSSRARRCTCCWRSRRDRPDRIAHFPCRRPWPQPAADGTAAEAGMNGWRLTGLLSLLLLAMAAASWRLQPDVEGLRLVIRATARTSLVLFALAFSAAGAGRSLSPDELHALAAAEPPLPRRLLRRVARHPSRGADRAGADRSDAVLDADRIPPTSSWPGPPICSSRR